MRYIITKIYLYVECTTVVNLASLLNITATVEPGVEWRLAGQHQD